MTFGYHLLSILQTAFYGDQVFRSRSRLHGPHLNRTVGTQRVNEVAGLSRLNGSNGHRNDIRPLLETQRYIYELPRPKTMIGVGEGGLQTHGARCLVYRVIDKA